MDKVSFLAASIFGLVTGLIFFFLDFITLSVTTFLGVTIAIIGYFSKK
tara:strand:+ start:498 stop:641 length:144 start_codon:yes stop_codon:yes gene_type:complete